MGHEDSRHRHCFNPRTTYEITKRRGGSWLACVFAALLLAVIWAVFALPATAQTTLRLVPHSDLKVLDPIWTTAFITRNHGYMIYDVLFAKDADGNVQPQMVDKYETSPDKLTWTFTLRPGLEWHDGKPVTAEDCVASIKRWAARDALGQQLMASIGEIKAARRTRPSRSC